MNVEEKLTRARIQIQNKNSFFAYLSLYLKFKNGKNNLPDNAGMGVDIKGNLYYGEEFVNKISNDELKGVLTHEILHLALLHLIRMGDKEKEIWNIATDITINSLLKKNGFDLPSGLIPDYNNKIEIDGYIIENCDEKTAEEIYFELIKNFPQDKRKGIGEININERFDEHFDSKGMSEKEIKEVSEDWNNKINEALVVAKMKGDIPAGFERLFGELHKEKIDWKVMLYNYITNQIPYNYCYSKPHKKSICVGEYLPHISKEKIDITILIDLSGSIGDKELSDFLSEIIGMAKAFKERINMRLLTHETEVNNNYKVDNGDIHKIKQLKINGGGGTSHIEPFNYIKEKVKDCKCVICLTDGYSDLDKINFNNYNFNKLFLITTDGTDEQIKDKNCKVINYGKC